MSPGPNRERQAICFAEARFLRQMQAVTNFTFIAGQLALSYSLDGQVNTMLFDAATSAGR